MYRIELARGEETVFRTIEELAVGIRNGLVTSRSRIYHHATQKWLPVEFHPHYKKALELSAHRQDLPPTRVPDRLETLSFAVPRPATTAPPTLSPPPAEPEPVVQAPVAAARVEPVVVKPVVVEPVVVEPVVVQPVVVQPVVAQPVVAQPVVADRVAVKRKVVERFIAEPAVASPVIEMPPATPTSVRFHPPLTIEPEPSAEAAAARRVALPPVVPSPVLQFPAIVYPEITPADPPIVEPAAAAARSRRSLQVAGAIVVLALGGYGMMSFASSPAGDPPSPAVADGPASPPATSEPAVSPATEAPASDVAVLKPVVMTRPASSGFAPALEPRAIVSTAAAAATPQPPLVAAKDSTLAPAPIDIQLDVPALPGGDSLVTPRAQTDSAMKRILRAVNGGRDLPQRP